MSWVDDWGGASSLSRIIDGAFYTAVATRLCFYAIPPASLPHSPTSADPPPLEGRCVEVDGGELVVKTADVSYTPQLVATLPQSPTLARVIGSGLDGARIFSYRKFDGNSLSSGDSLHDLAAIEITLTHSDVAIRPKAVAREMSATLAARANRYSPFQTPLYPRPGQVNSLRFTATHDTVTVMWTAPTSGGEPSKYLVRWKVSTEANFTNQREVDDPMLAITGLTTGTTYTVEVTAINAVGSGTASEIEATPTTTTTTTTTVAPTTTT